MKKLILFLIVAVPMTAAIAHQGDADKPYFSKTFDNESVKTLRAETSGGSLTVTGTNEKEGRIEVYIKGNNGINKLSNEEIKARLDENYTVDLALENNELRAIASRRGNINWKNSLSISFRIYVPSTVSSKLATSGGSIRLSNLKGDQEFKTSGGSLHLEGLDGMINGRTSGGSIHVSNAKGTIDLKTSGGSIEASDCNGTIDLATSGGSLRLQQLQGNIKARTSGGSIKGGNISGELFSHTSGGSINLEQLACSLDASTSAGSVYAGFTKPGKSVKVNVSAGSTTLALPKNAGLSLDLGGRKINTGALNNFNGVMDKDQVKGTLNGGGSEIYVRNSVGSISIDWN